MHWEPNFIILLTTEAPKPFWIIIMAKFRLAKSLVTQVLLLSVKYNLVGWSESSFGSLGCDKSSGITQDPVGVVIICRASWRIRIRTFSVETKSDGYK